MSGTRIRVNAGNSSSSSSGSGGGGGGGGGAVRNAASGRNSSPAMLPTSTSTSTSASTSAPRSTPHDAFFKDVDSEFCKLTSFEVRCALKYL